MLWNAATSKSVDGPEGRVPASDGLKFGSDAGAIPGKDWSAAILIGSTGDRISCWKRRSSAVGYSTVQMLRSVAKK